MNTPRCLLHNDELSLEIAPMGAEMQYLRTADGNNLLWHGDDSFWSGRAPVLFPIVGRAVGDMISIGEHTAPMPQHGFARRSLFAIEEKTDLSSRHVLTESAESLLLFPFAFTLHLTHTLDGKTLTVCAQVQNNSAEPMPFGIGFHPAFCWPLPNSEQTVHSITLATASSAPIMQKLKNGLLTQKTIPSPFIDGKLELHEGLFNEGALIFPNGSEALRYGPPVRPALEFKFSNLPDLALWHPTGAPFICIEPWHGTASFVGDSHQLSQRPNSIVLDPEAKVQFGYAVTVMT